MITIDLSNVDMSLPRKKKAKRVSFSEETSMLRMSYDLDV